MALPQKPNTCIAAVFQTGNHLKISLVDFVHSVKQIKDAWLLELIKLCSISYVEGLSQKVSVPLPLSL